jgi:alpha-N-arabinofuranosidase
VADAAYLTGMERNADLVIMNCYAPLFVNVNPGGRQWAVDLIGYDALTSFGSPSYYVQKMFSNNLGNVVLSVKLDSVPMAKVLVPPARGGRRGAAPPPLTQPTYADRDGVYASASRDNSNGDVILKLVNVQNTPQPIQVDLQGLARVSRNATIELLTGGPDDVNTVADPMKVAPKKVTIAYAATKFMHELPAHSVSVVRLKTK